MRLLPPRITHRFLLEIAKLGLASSFSLAAIDWTENHNLIRGREARPELPSVDGSNVVTIRSWSAG